MSRSTFSVDGDPVAPQPKPSGGLLTDLRGSGTDPVVADAPLAVPKRKRVATQTLVLALVLVASAASLYTMRKQGMAAGIVFKPVKLDYEPDKGKPEDLKQQQKVMADLARSVLPQTFNDAPLLKNPFLLDNGVPLAAVMPSGPDATQAAATQRAEEIRTHLGNLALNGVMMGPTPLARIAGKTYTVSDTVDGLFMIKEIRDRSVDLLVDDKIYTLQMSDTSAPSGSGRRPQGFQPSPGRR